MDADMYIYYVYVCIHIIYVHKPMHTHTHIRNLYLCFTKYVASFCYPDTNPVCNKTARKTLQE